MVKYKLCYHEYQIYKLEGLSQEEEINLRKKRRIIQNRGYAQTIRDNKNKEIEDLTREKTKLQVER